VETERPATQVMESQVEQPTATRALEEGLRRMLACFPTSPDVQQESPLRVISALEEMTRGYLESAEEILVAAQFPAPGDDLVILKDIEFVSLCEHHLMPFSGQAHVAYVPEDYVVGLSKLARLVDCFARRFQMQERLGHEIAMALMEHVSAAGAACVIEATHGCLSCRGARKSRATFITSAMLGKFRAIGELRREFFAAIQLTHTRI
jgi:GTP cyclohydrolase I